MRLSKGFLIAAMVLALVASSVSVRPARADDLEKFAIITGAVLGGIIVLVVVGTMLTRDDPRFLTEGYPGMPQNVLPSDSPLKFGAACPGGVDSLVVCW